MPVPGPIPGPTPRAPRRLRRRAPRAALLALGLLLPAGPLTAAPLSPVGCAGAHCPAEGAAPTRAVADAAGLREALRAARGGEVIALAPGVYGALDLRGFAPSSPVTLRSADPGDPARITGMALRDVSNLHLEGLVLDFVFDPSQSPTQARPFQIHGGSGIEIRRATFDGAIARGTGSEVDDGYAAGVGIAARGTKGLAIRDSLFTQWFRGAVLRDIDGLVLAGNRITAIRSDGLNLIAVEDALVEGNEITAFRRSLGSADHADMIQFWTNRTDRPSRRVTIRGNVLHAGGGEATQSIFMRNEEVDHGRAGREMFYRDILIEDNVIANAHLHGITVGETQGLTIRRNTLVRVPSAVREGEGRSRALSVPTIRVAERSRGVTVEGNVTGPLRAGQDGGPGLVRGHDGQPDWRVSGNVMAQDETPGAPGWYGDLFVAPMDPDRPIAGLRARPGGPLDGARAGAERLAYDPAPEALVPVIRAEPEGGVGNLYRFDAGLSTGPGGPLGARPGATAEWRFPDGATAQGLETARALPPGAHRIEATIRFPDGAEAVARTTLVVPSPQVLVLKPEAPFALGSESVSIGADRIAGYFGAADLTLALRFRATGAQPAGEILRIHPGIVISLGALGDLEVMLRTQDRDPVRLRTAPLRLHDGAWHEAELRYDAATGEIRLAVDGVARAQGRSAGRLMPRESWGLTLGRADRSFQGEVASVAIEADTGAFRPVGG